MFKLKYTPDTSSSSSSSTNNSLHRVTLSKCAAIVIKYQHPYSVWKNLVRYMVKKNKFKDIDVQHISSRYEYSSDIRHRLL